MSSTFNPRQYTDIIASQNLIITQLAKEKCALQAKIDALMLEYCPEEMTQEQVERWEESQTIFISSVNPPAVPDYKEYVKAVYEYK